MASREATFLYQFFSLFFPLSFSFFFFFLPKSANFRDRESFLGSVKLKCKLLVKHGAFFGRNLVSRVAKINSVASNLSRTSITKEKKKEGAKREGGKEKKKERKKKKKKKREREKKKIADELFFATVECHFFSSPLF